MSRRKKVVLSLAVGLLTLVIIAAGVIFFILRSSMAAHQGAFSAGTTDEVVVIRDERGVAYIRASSAEDLYFAQGYIHAQERLWQMEFNRRVIQGRLSEMIGPGLIESDIFLRTVGLHRITERVLEKTSPAGRAAMQSYARGVNAYLEKAKPTPEMLLLGVRPEPWTEFDVAGIVTLLAFDLSSNWNIEAVRLGLEAALPPELFAELLPPFTEWDSPSIWSKDQAYGQINVDGILSLLERAALDKIDPFLPRLGSNSWVLSPERYEEGVALLANDPHLSVSLPSIWYEVCLELDDGMKVYGWSIPGSPGVVVGHNQYLAWGLTNIGDTQDLFLEERDPENPHRFRYEGEWYDAEVIVEEIAVKGQDEPELVEVIITRNGPLVSNDPPLSLRWTAYDFETSTFDAILGMNAASDWDQFRQALFYFTIPVQNVVYADVEGNIGFRTAGLLPIRKAGAGLMPSPGWSADYGWEGYIPMAELPELFNPPRGYIATANHRVVSDDYPYLIAIDDAPPYRMMRLVEQLESKPSFSLKDIKGLQNDWYNNHAAVRLPAWLEVLNGAAGDLSEVEQEGLRLLNEWVNYPVSSPDKPAPAIYANWYLHFISEVFAEKMGDELYKRFTASAYIVYKALDYMLEQGEAVWFEPGLDQLLLTSYRSSMAELIAVLGPEPGQWQWHQLQTISFDHVLGEEDMLRPFFCRGPYPHGGDMETLGRSNYPLNDPFNITLIAGSRFIAVLKPQIEAYGVIAGGQSGHFLSRQYADQIDTWLRGDYNSLVFSAEDLEDEKIKRMFLKP